MGDLDSLDDLGSIFEEPEPAPEAAPGPELEALPDTRLGELVGEFLTIDHRRVHGDPPLDQAESQRLAELHELLAYELGSAGPPLAGSRRSSLRVPTQLKVHMAGSGESVANLCNLSHGGAFIEMPNLPALGTTIDSGHGAAPLQVAATVKWLREIANLDGPAGVGVEFEGIEDDDFIALEKLVARLLCAQARDEA